MLEYAPIALPIVLVFASWMGWRIQRGLSERHRAHETVDAVRLILGMLVTFAALVLGLLTSTAKSHFDGSEAALQAYGVDLISLDQRLREYGPEAEPSRLILRAYVAAAVADTWPEELPPTGDYPRHPNAIEPGSAESIALGEMLLQVDRAVGRLTPTNATQQRLAAALLARVGETLQQRWMVVASAQPVTSWPFMGVMAVWLSLVFVMYGLSSPGNPLVFVAVLLTALSVSLAMALIVELETPLSGYLKVSSLPLRQALVHMDQPPYPR